MPYFIFIGADKPESTGIRERTRPAHRAYIRQDQPDCRVAAGGPLTEDAGTPMIGTMLILEAADRSAAIRFLSDDPYAKASLFETIQLRRLEWSFGAPETKP